MRSDVHQVHYVPAEQVSKVLVFGNDCGFCSRISGAAAPLGTLFFLSIGIFGSGSFWGRGLEVWLCFLGLWGGTRARGV